VSDSYTSGCVGCGFPGLVGHYDYCPVLAREAWGNTDKDTEIKCLQGMIEQRDRARIGRVDIIAKLTKEKRVLKEFIKTEADWLEEQGFGTDAERFRTKGGGS